MERARAGQKKVVFILLKFQYPFTWASLVAQRLKRLPPMRETWVRSLGWEDSLEKEMATHSNILAWRIPWTEEPGGLQSMGLQRVRCDLAIKQQQGLQHMNLGGKEQIFSP